MVYLNKAYRFIENSSKMTFTEKNKTFCVKIDFLIIEFDSNKWKKTSNSKKAHQILVSLNDTGV